MIFRVEGERQVLRALSQVSRAAGRTARIELKRAALNVQNGARTRVPIKTGRLRNSLSHEIEDLTATVGTNVEYGPYVELGTRHMPGRPYLFPALEAERASFLSRLRSALKGAMVDET